VVKRKAVTLIDPLGFSLAYDARIVESPATGARPDHEFVWRESRASHKPGPWLFVRVEPHAAPAWTGAFDTDAPGCFLTGIYGLPPGDDVLVVASGEGYVVSAYDPANWYSTPVAPVRGVRRVEGAPLVVLWDFQDLAVLGPDGVQWTRREFATDDLEVTRAADGTIEGTLWRTWFGERDHRPFKLDAATGRLLEGEEEGRLETSDDPRGR